MKKLVITLLCFGSLLLAAKTQPPVAMPAATGQIGIIPSTYEPARGMDCAMEARLEPAPRMDWSFPRVLDTSMMYSYSADHDPLTGYYYAAVGTWSDSAIRLYWSADYGATWSGLASIHTNPACLFYKLDLVVARGESSFLHVFARWDYNGGDIYDYRISLDGAPFSYFGVATGPDTVDDFSACADYRPQYGLYCFWANQQREGTNGGFMTSTDYGVTWSSQHAGSAWDVDVSATADNDINAAFVAAPGRKQVLYQRNNNYGDPSGWLSTVSVAYDTMQHYNPRVISALTLPDSSATTWLLYHYDWQNSGDWDVEFAIRSNAWADTWNRGYTLSNEAGAFEYFPDLTNFKELGCTRVAATYSRVNAARDTGFVYWQTAEAASPQYWTAKQAVNDTFRLVDIYIGSALVGGSVNGGVVFSKGIPGNLLPIGLYFNSSALPGVEEPGSRPLAQALRVFPNPAKGRVRFALPTPARDVAIYNLAGNLIRTLTGSSPLSWDGTDSRGVAAAPGLYVIRAITATGTASAKLIYSR
jgi:hypothetical protein